MAFYDGISEEQGSHVLACVGIFREKGLDVFGRREGKTLELRTQGRCVENTRVLTCSAVDELLGRKAIGVPQETEWTDARVVYVWRNGVRVSSEKFSKNQERKYEKLNV